MLTHMQHVDYIHVTQLTGSFLSTSKSNRILKLAELEVAEPRQFWAAVKKITKTSHTEKPNISPSSWTDYLRELLNIKYNANPSNNYADYVENCLHTIECHAFRTTNFRS